MDKVRHKFDLNLRLHRKPFWEHCKHSIESAIRTKLHKSYCSCYHKLLQLLPLQYSTHTPDHNLELITLTLSFLCEGETGRVVGSEDLFNGVNVSCGTEVNAGVVLHRGLHDGPS